jgi:GT2 family glycosyltransferase
MDNITILVCLYKKDLGNSETLRSLMHNAALLQEARIYVWDNSPHRMAASSLNILKGSFTNFKYVHTPENTVLSKVYNEAIKEQTNLSGYLMLCDDDSEIPAAFFNDLNTSIKLHPEVNLFLPKIYVQGTMVSPAKDLVYTTRFIDDHLQGPVSSKHTTAINSCMVISNRVFLKGFQYDRKLNFYGTDNYFMYKYSQSYPELYVLNVAINHDLSFKSADLTRKLKIFRETRRANKIVYSDNKLHLLTIMLNNFAVSVKHCLKYKTLAFLYD